MLHVNHLAAEYEDRVDTLEAEVAELKAEIAKLRAAPPQLPAEDVDIRIAMEQSNLEVVKKELLKEKDLSASFHGTLVSQGATISSLRAQLREIEKASLEREATSLKRADDEIAPYRCVVERVERYLADRPAARSLDERAHRVLGGLSVLDALEQGQDLKACRGKLLAEQIAVQKEAMASKYASLDLHDLNSAEVVKSAVPSALRNRTQGEDRD